MSDREIEVFNLSFIDLLACGLGGVLLLMLLFASLSRAEREISAAASAAGGLAREELLSSGDELPPAEPMFVTLRWKGEAPAPLVLSAYPPLPSRAGLVAQVTTGGRMRIKLTKHEPVKTVDVGGRPISYRGLFFNEPRRDGWAGGVTTFFLPNSRNFLADLDQLVASSRPRLVPPASLLWRFSVHIAAGPAPRLQRELQRTRDAWRDALQAEPHLEHSGRLPFTLEDVLEAWPGASDPRLQRFLTPLKGEVRNPMSANPTWPIARGAEHLEGWEQATPRRQRLAALLREALLPAMAALHSAGTTWLSDDLRSLHAFNALYQHLLDWTRSRRDRLRRSEGPLRWLADIAQRGCLGAGFRGPSGGEPLSDLLRRLARLSQMGAGVGARGALALPFAPRASPEGIKLTLELVGHGERRRLRPMHGGPAAVLRPGAAPLWFGRP